MNPFPKHTARVFFSIACGMVFFLLVGISEVLLYRKLDLRPDVWFCLFTWPIGVGLGWRTCSRHYLSRRFQAGSLTIGILALALSSWAGAWLYLRSKELSNAGGFAGIGEMALSFVCAFIAVAFLFLTLSGLILRLASPPPQTVHSDH